MNDITIVKETEMQLGLQTTLDQRTLLRYEFDEVSKLELTSENEPLFRELRLKWAKNRTKGVNDWHKKGKAVSLAVGKWYDAKKNELNREGEEIEALLLSSENHAANVRLEKLKAINDKRFKIISPYLEDSECFDFSELTQEEFKAHLLEAKRNHAARLKMEADWEVARQAEIDADKIENARLQKERDKLIAEAKKRDIEAVRIKEANYKLLKEEKDARSKLEDELNDKLASERNEAIQKEALHEIELSKGDSEKVKDLIKDLNSIKGKYSFKSESNKKMYSDTEKLVDRVINHINKVR